VQKVESRHFQLNRGQFLGTQQLHRFYSSSTRFCKLGIRRRRYQYLVPTAKYQHDMDIMVRTSPTWSPNVPTYERTSTMEYDRI
jgi:hypothetical protein